MAASSNKDSDKDLEFHFDDCDEYQKEISELYTYTEETEFDTNLANFEALLKSKGTCIHFYQLLTCNFALSSKKLTLFSLYIWKILLPQIAKCYSSKT